MPARRPRRGEPRRVSAASSSAAARVAPTVTLMPARRVRATGHPRRELRRTGRRRTRGGCGCRRSRAARTARRRRSAGRPPARGRCRPLTIDASLEHDVGVGERAERTVASSPPLTASFVTSTPMWSITVVVTRPPWRRASSARHVDTHVGAVTHDHLAADHDVVDVGRRGREHDALEQLTRGGHRPSAPSRDEPCTGRPAHPPRAARPRASRGWRGRWWSPPASRLGASWLPRTRFASRSSSSTARASSNRSITACESEPSASGDPASRNARAGPMPSARSRSVVGHRHTVVRLAPSSVDVAVGEVGGVDGGEALAEHAVPVEQARRV